MADIASLIAKGPPKLDFSAIMNVPDAFAQGQQIGADFRARRALQGGLPRTADGSIDFAAAADLLAKAGDKDAALGLVKSTSGINGVYGTPIYGTDAQGNTVLGALDKRGGFRRVNTGGVTVTPGIRTVDTGTGTAVIDSRTGRPVQGAAPGGVIPKDVAGEARGKKLGTEQGEKIAGMGQAKASLDSASNNLDRMAFEARRIMSDPAVTRITGLWSMLPSLPGGAAANLEAKLETLKSQVGFGVLQAMRDASKTGGALGQVSNIENQLLQNNLAALSQAQSADEFKRAMQQIIEYAEGAKQRLKGAFDHDYASLPTGGTTAPAQARETKTIGGKTYFKENGQWFEE